MTHAASRIYVVHLLGKHFLIRAVNRKQALHYVATETMTARVARQDDFLRMAESGPLRVSDARAYSRSILLLDREGETDDVRAA